MRSGRCTAWGPWPTSNRAAAAAAMAALEHPSAGVRRNAVQVLPRDARSAGAVLAAGLLRDPDAQVRLAALLSLADQPPSDEAGAAARRCTSRRAGDERPVAGRRGHGGRGAATPSRS